MSRCFRLTLALVACVLLSASPVLPQSRPGTAPHHTASFSEALQSFLPEVLTRLWEALGCDVDPYGSAWRPVALHPLGTSALTSVHAKLGCSIDPYGRCINATQQTSGH